MESNNYNFADPATRNFLPKKRVLCCALNMLVVFLFFCVFFYNKNKIFNK